MRVTVRLFARLRDIAGSGELQHEVQEPATVEAVWLRLADEFPGFPEFRPAISCAVNAEYARFDMPVRDGDEVAFLPPVSGG